MDNTETINILSLCTGYGGLELGLARALEGIFRVVAVEVEAYALANLAAKAQEGKLAVEAMWPDLKTFPAERFRGCFDFILAGYPCQPFSVAGKRAGGSDPRHLWTHIRRIIKAVKPLYVCIENVPGLLSARILDNRPDIVEYLTALAEEERKADARHRWYISEHRRRITARLLRQEGIQAYAGVYLDLQDIGYQIEPGLFTASECGAPHKRQRLFILAYNTKFRRRAFTKVQQAGEFNVELCCQAMADTAALRIQRPEPERTASARRQINEQKSIVKYPARPGQPQYEWEEPRVVVHTGKQKSTGVSGSERQEVSETGNASGQEQAESGVGRAVNGHSCRVDRLRLLGNGVVPQQAELAFIELMRLFE